MINLVSDLNECDTLTSLKPTKRLVWILWPTGSRREPGVREQITGL